MVNDVAEPLVLSRALHYTATILMAGVISFRGLIAGSARWRSEKLGVDRQLRLIFWSGFALAFASGAGWFFSVSAAIDGSTWGGAVASGTAAMVLTETQFGHVWTVRLIVGMLLGVAVGAAIGQGIWRRSFALSLVAVLAGSLAFTGHAASAPGFKGDIHLLSDVPHIIAVCAWVGSLVPYALYLGSIDEGSRSSSEVIEITRRFSILGMIAVLTIATTGIINSLYLVGSVHLLTHTEYGQLLLAKAALFIAMVSVAAINRYWLVPALSSRGAVKQLRRNSLIEACLGLLIVCIVALLGTMPPATLE